MGNLVTNRITLNAMRGSIPEEMMLQLIADLTGRQPEETLIAIRGSEPGYGLWHPVTLGKVVPSPDILAGLPEEHIGLTDLALALASDNPDYIALTSHQDPFEHLMAPEMSRTRIGILDRHGFAGLLFDEARNHAEREYPGILAAGAKMKDCVDQTGFSDPVAWREEHWGTRACAEDGLFLITDEGGISVRFDTVNAAPSAFIEALGARYPSLQIQAKGYDEDTEYAFSAITDGGEGQIYWVEEHGPDAVAEAISIVHPRSAGSADVGMEP